MAGNGTTGEDAGVSFSSPIVVLPILVAVVTLLAVAIAGCALYRKHQRKRARKLARQLKVTEMKIDAIGSLKARKEQELAARQTVEYLPSRDVVCRSTASPRDGTAWQEAEASREEGGPQEAAAGGLGKGGATEHRVQAAASIYAGDEDASSAFTVDAYEMLDSSMAVECHTAPSLSSLSTAGGRPRFGGARVSSTQPAVPVFLRPRSQSLSTNTGTCGSDTVRQALQLAGRAQGPWGDAPGLMSREEAHLNTPVSSSPGSGSSLPGNGYTSDGTMVKWV